MADVSLYRDRVKARKHELADVAPAIIAGLAANGPGEWKAERRVVDYRPLRRLVDGLFESRAMNSTARAQLRNEISRLEHG